MKRQSLPSMPHAFKNVGKKTANLIVMFRSNVWKYDVLDFSLLKLQQNPFQNSKNLKTAWQKK